MRLKQLLLMLILCGFLLGFWQLRRHHKRLEDEHRKKKLQILSHPLSHDIPPFVSKQQVSKPRLKNVTVFVWEWSGEPGEHWAGFGGDRLELPNYLGAEVEKTCDIGCRFTGDRRRIGEADGVIVETPVPHFDHWAQEGVDLPQKRPHQKWILLSYETPIYFPAQVQPEFQRLVDYNMTYEQQSEMAVTLTCSWGGGTIEDFLRPPPPKPKHLAPVVFMATNCGAGGAEARGAYVRELMNYVKVDSYGGCLHNKDMPKEMQFAIYSDHGSSMKNKIKIFSQYKFALTFENNNVTDYVTEKYVNALQAGTVPVYMGAPNIDSWVPGERAIIKTSDFAGPRELGMYLNALAEADEEYMKFFEWKKKGLLPQFVEKYNRCIFYGAECRLCHLLSKTSSRSELPSFVQEQLGVLPRVLMLNGTSFVQVPHQALFNRLRKELTFAAWIKPDRKFRDWRIIDKNTPSESDGFCFDVLHFQGLGFLRLCNGECYLSTRAVHLGAWQHVAVTFSSLSKKGRFYINGKLDSEFEVLGNGHANSFPLAIGGSTGGADGEPCCGWVGKLDDVSIWNVPLSEEGVKSLLFQQLLGNEPGLLGYYLFNEYNPTNKLTRDSSVNNNHGTLVGTSFAFVREEDKLLRFLPI